MCVHESVKYSRLVFDPTKGVSILTWNVHYKCCFFIKRFGPHHQFHNEIVTKRLQSNCFLIFRVISFFFLVLEAITIAAVKCKTSFMRELSVTCNNALWEWFKMVDDWKTVMFFFKNLFIHKLSHKELLY